MAPGTPDSVFPSREDGCCVCGERDGSVSVHMHHVIPRSCGGERGPVVPLCAICHDAIHHAASLGITADDYADRTDRKAALRDRTAADALIGAIADAESVVRRSARRRVSMSLSLPADVSRALSRAASMAGKSRSATAVLILRASLGRWMDGETADA